MGPALDSLHGIRRIAHRTPATLAAVGVLGMIALVASAVTSVAPILGWLLGIPVLAFGLGAAYAVTDHGLFTGALSTEVGVDLVRERWLSLLGAYALLVVLWLTALVVLFALILVLVIAGALVSSAVDLPEIATVVPFGLLLIMFGGVYFCSAMVTQFLFPAVAINGDPAVDAVKSAIRVVRDAPASVAGFTVIRVALEYGLIVVGLAVIVAVGALDPLITDVLAGAADPGFLVEAVDIVGVLAVLTVLLSSVAIGQALRITYTTAFFTGEIRG
ncbi:DUF7847 domain-containing protein [Halorubrum vacuolatum]|uniref:DUF7847 domain-containing protein n=1 Tax=Halorubrum vacuolatum TaxID=63740 RepID=A0A238Y0S6_HALVU|nr:hypothetical protein [Halorubrum vacuolatum]SNR64572.1 hypothetical protein SAMN06264855_1274 [Halorubrum vacuolatum]